MPPESQEGVLRPLARKNVDDVRYIGSLEGRYILASRERRLDSSVKVFACRVKSVTPRRIVLAAPVIGAKGEWATLQVQELGLLRVEVEDMLDFGFSANIVATDEERVKLSRKIAWVKKRALHAWPDQREHRRVIPKSPRSTLIFADGEKIDCFLIDISRSGAAVSADVYPRIGMPLAIGRVLARVVRHLDVGFAVQFVEVQETETLEARLADDLSENAADQVQLPLDG